VSPGHSLVLTPRITARGRSRSTATIHGMYLGRVRQKLPGSVEVRLKRLKSTLRLKIWISTAFNRFQPRPLLTCTRHVWSYCIKTLGIHLCAFFCQAIQRRSIAYFETSLRALLVTFECNLEFKIWKDIHQAMIAQTEAEDQSLNGRRSVW